MTDDEKAEGRRERLAERRRIRVAAGGAVAGVVVASALVVMLAFVVDHRLVAMLQPLLALALSVSLTLGARAVDGPIRLAGRRREAASASAGAAALLLWLGCFSAIQAAFLVVDVVSRWNPGRTSCPTEAKSQLQGTLVIVDGAVKRTVVVTGCEVGKPKANGGASLVHNGQAPVDVSANQDEVVN